MSIIDDYKEGMHFFQEKEYARAIEIDLPEESIEAICVHELMHTFSADHNSRFIQSLKNTGDSVYMIEILD